jgi:spore photoproduct lyase
VDDLTFELITHRYTQSAKRVIEERYPKTKLDMDDEKRRKKWGPYGRIKYVYPKEQMDEIKDFMHRTISTYFPRAEILYFT